jgi:hypothetical protein
MVLDGFAAAVKDYSIGIPLMTEHQYLVAIEAMNAHLPWYAQQKDTPEVRAMILSVYTAVLAAK